MKFSIIALTLLASQTFSFTIDNEQTAVALRDPTECIEQHCPSEYQSCQKDHKCIPALEDCQKKCGTKTSCWTFCLPSKGSQAAIDVAKCASKHNCLAKSQENRHMRHEIEEKSTAIALRDPTECIEQHCPSEYQSCQKDHKCIPALEDCQKKCGTKTSCWTFCLPSKGSQAAIDVAKCASKHNCLAKSHHQHQEKSTAVALRDPTECIEQHCPSEYQSCQKDHKCIPALEDCQKKCGTKTSCWTFCLPSKGSQAAIDVAKCASKHNCLAKSQENRHMRHEIEEKSTAIALRDPTECIEQHCPSEYQSCQKDHKCIPALEDCQKKCGTKTSCWTFCLPSKGSQAAIDVAKCASKHNCLSQSTQNTQVNTI